MRPQKKRPTRFLLFVEMLEDRTTPASVFWDGGGDGTRWQDRFNWSTDQLPGASDDVTVTADQTVVFDAGTGTVRRLTMTTPIAVTGGTLTLGPSGGLGSQLNSTLGIYGGVVRITSAQISGTGSIDNSGSLFITTSTVGTRLANSGTIEVTGPGSAITGGFSQSQTAILRVTTASPLPAILRVDGGFENKGTIELISAVATGSTLQVTLGTLVNSGVIRSSPGGGGTRSLLAELDNRGTLDVRHPLTLQKVEGGNAHHLNSGTVALSGGNLTVSQSGTTPSFASTGTIDVGAGRTLVVSAGEFSVNGNGALRVDPEGVLDLATPVLGTTRNADLYSPAGQMIVRGGSSSSPRLLEIMGRDLGPGAAGYVNNFAIGTLSLAASSYIRLVDTADNAPGPEAMYVDRLIVPAGATLDLNGQKLYARDAEILGTVLGVLGDTPGVGPLPMNSTGTSQLPAAAYHEWEFFGRPGQPVTVFVNPTPGGGTPLGYASVAVTDSAGNVLASTSGATSGEVVYLRGVTLPADGTYRIRVGAAPANPTAAGRYRVGLFDATVGERPLVFGQREVGGIEAKYRTDRWTSTAAANTSVRFRLHAADSPVKFRLLGPNGWTGFVDQTASSGPITLPYDGDYVLEAYTNATGTGEYAFTMEGLVATELTLGTPHHGTVAGNGQAQLFRVTVPEGKRLLLNLDDSNSLDRNEIFVKFGTPPTREDYQFRSEGDAAADQRVLVPAAAEGTWYVLVYAVAAPTPSRFTLTATAADVFLTGVTPGRHSRVAETVLTLTGAGFDPVTTVTLVAADGTTYSPSFVSLDTPTQLTVTVATASLPAGTYSVRVEKSGGDAATLPNALELLPGGSGPKFQANLDLPIGVRPTTNETLYVRYANTGDVAIPAPLLTLRASGGSLMTLDRTLVTRGVWRGSNRPDGFSDTIQILASGKTPGVLQPGEQVRIPVYYVGLTDGTANSVQFSLDTLTASETRRMNWTEPLYQYVVQNWSRVHIQTGSAPASGGGGGGGGGGNFSTSSRDLRWAFVGHHDELVNDTRWVVDEDLFDNYDVWSEIEEETVFASPLQTTLRPPGMSDEVWESVFPNLRTITGETWGDYVRALARSAEYLGRLGLNVTDAGELWAFHLQQAIGLTPVGALGSTVDAYVQLPGPDLSLVRSYNPSLIGRHEAGVFGRGWSIAGGWEDRLTVELGGIVVITSPGGSQRRFQKDLRGGYFSEVGDQAVLTREVDGFILTEQSGQKTRYRSDGRVDYTEDANGNRVTATYSGDRLTGLGSPAGGVVFEYNGFGRISRMTDAVGRVTEYAYDAVGEHLTSVRGRDGDTTAYTYSTNAGENHALLSISGPGGEEQFFEYDDFGRLSRVAECPCGGSLGEPTVYTYELGRVTAIDGLGNRTQTFFDHRGRVAKTIDPLGNPQYFEYDAFSNLTAVTDAAGQTYDFEYDSRGNLTEAFDPLGATTRFEYDGPFGKLTRVIDGRGNPLSYEYDTDGNVTAVVYADGSRERYAYDATGAVITDTNRRFQAVSLTYDPAGRPETRTLPDGTQESFGYDARGNLVRVTDGQGDTTLAYDADDRPTRIEYPTGRWLEYAYDATGRRTQITGPDGYEVNYAYDSYGRLDRVSDGSGATLADYAYDAAGRLVRTDKGNGAYTTYEYDAAGQVLHLVNHAPGGPVNSRFDYAYDTLGRRTSMTILEGRWDYEYDAIGQLMRAVFASNNTTVIPNQDLRYEYDDAGNRVRTVENGVVTQYATNNLNQYTTVGSSTLRYDLDGNLIEEANAGGVTRYTYDVLNRLTGVTDPTGTRQHEYDAFGGRRAVVANGVRTEYLIDPTGLGNVVAESDGSGTRIASYVYGLGLESAGWAGGTWHYDFDALGSTAGVSNTAGGYANRYVYDPFGESLLSAEVIPNPFEFVGAAGVMADGNDLHFMRARYYETDRGQFVTQDPIGLLGGDANLYRYSLNSPIQFVDPSGLIFGPILKGLTSTNDCQLLGSLIGGAIGAAIGATVGATYGGAIGTTVGAVGGAAIGSFIPGLGTVAGGIAGGINGGVAGRAGGSKIGGVLGGFLGGKLGGAFGTAVCDNLLPPPPSDPPKPKTPTHPSLSPPPVPVNRSRDPNQKVGPGGFGQQNFVAAGAVLPYRIDFENDATATAPAQRVTVSDVLPPELDLDTLRFAEVGFGDLRLAVPANAARHYRTTVDYSIAGDTMRVQIELGIRPGTREVYAVFQSLDAQSDLPPHLLAGFLPPEDGTGRGQGFFSYTAGHTPGLPTGTEIRNVATIVFDEGEIIDTNQVDPHDPARGTDPNKEALVTLDADGPTSAVDELPPTTTTNLFTLSWGGQDDPGGSGVAHYDVYVSENGGAFALWRDDTTETSAEFLGRDGYSYRFYSVATDNVGHTQTIPAAAQAETLVEVPATNQPPTAVSLAPAVVAENAAPGTVVGTLGTTDPDADDTFTYELLDDAGGAFALSGDRVVVAGPIDYEATPGHVLTVRVRTTDSADNRYEQDLDITVTNVLEVTGFDVQRNQTQRSYVRYADVTFADAPADVPALLDQGRVRLVRYGLDGTGGAEVSLAGVLSAAGQTLTLDFGPSGLGGNRNTTAGDGYYALRLDLDGDGVSETTRAFYRLLGDVDGNRTVEVADANLIPPAYGTANPERDANGDGVVNATDRTLALRSVGRRLAPGLPLDD